ncbi:MAG: DUF3793 family protein [Clostridia bacterium]|nr:DUF3793 family protein [Clostridia bacterium]
MMERYLIEHCAPTLASLKTASLFTIELSCDMDFERMILYYNESFAPKGIEFFVMRKRDNKALIYVYRRSSLIQDLTSSAIKLFLDERGYKGLDLESALQKLSSRIIEDDNFPHEIGVFLGYPLHDVMGFINSGGRNCKYIGCWKVYGDKCEAVKTFARFNKCKDIYKRLWEQGRSVLQLTVSA